MGLQQAKILLEKINALYKSMSLDEGDIAGIERDLMLSYLRQLYEQFRMPDNSPAPPQRETAPQREQSPAPPPRRQPEPEAAPPARAEATAYTPPPAPAPARPPQQAEHRPAQYRSHEPTPAPEQRPTSVKDSNLRSLFEHQAARELSEKLGESRIGDLTKSMTINDRLLFANTLFNGDSRTMMSTLEQLNNFQSMDQARPMLEDMARQYNWTEEDNADTARSFIKLVRRRYNN